MIPIVSWTGLLNLALVMDKMERYHPKERHYYLQFFGVVPEHQGRGTGTDLMKPILDICDREKCVAYLENSKEANLAFYGRFGFIVTKKISLGKDSPSLWLMWRSPRTLRQVIKYLKCNVDDIERNVSDIRPIELALYCIISRN